MYRPRSVYVLWWFHALYNTITCTRRVRDTRHTRRRCTRSSIAISEAGKHCARISAAHPALAELVVGVLQLDRRVAGADAPRSRLCRVPRTERRTPPGPRDGGAGSLSARTASHAGDHESEGHSAQSCDVVGAYTHARVRYVHARARLVRPMREEAGA
jgi:hypothetical protein